MIGFSVYIFILAGMFFSSTGNTLPDSAPLKDSGRIEIRGIYGSPEPVLEQEYKSERAQR